MGSEHRFSRNPRPATTDCELVSESIPESFSPGWTHLRGGIDEIAEDVAQLGSCIAVADTSTEQPVQTAGHQRQPQVAVDLHE